MHGRGDSGLNRFRVLLMRPLIVREQLIPNCYVSDFRSSAAGNSCREIRNIVGQEALAYLYHVYWTLREHEGPGSTDLANRLFNAAGHWWCFRDKTKVRTPRERNDNPK